MICDPVGTVEIADRCGVTRSAVDAWRSRDGRFPRPRWTVGGRPAWNWPDVEAWAHLTRRPAGVLAQGLHKAFADHLVDAPPATLKVAVFRDGDEANTHAEDVAVVGPNVNHVVTFATPGRGSYRVLWSSLNSKNADSLVAVDTFLVP